MPRTILTEEPVHSDGQEEQQSTVSKENVTVIETSEESTLITSPEMEKLFYEWSVTGKNDLMINPTLAERIRQYLRYQEELDPLKVQLAERIYKPFVVNCDTEYKCFDLCVNEQKLGKFNFYLFDNFYRVIHISTFRYILTQVRNPYVPYIDVSKELFIDIGAYALTNNGKYIFKDGTYYVTLK